MILPVSVLILCLNFPVNNFNGYGLIGVNYESFSKVIYSTTYQSDSYDDLDNSVSDNICNCGENNGVTQESFSEFRGEFRQVFENVETHFIEIDNKLALISEFLKYICAFGLFIVLILLLKYIYKLFNIFF